MNLIAKIGQQKFEMLKVKAAGTSKITDFEYELQMSQTNQRMKPDIETMFLTTSIEYSYLSSTTVREIAAFGGDVSQFVPEAVEIALREKMKEKRRV